MEIQEINEHIYSNNPFVCTYDNLLTPEECNHFINLSKGKLEQALVSNDKKGVLSNGRTGLNTWIQHNHDEITKSVGERIASIVKMPLENAEKYQIIYYGKTQEYRQHYDSWEHNYSEKTLRCMKYGGARIKTALCYLNTVEKGGGTKMTRKNIIVEAKQGRLLVFHNTYDNTNIRHELSEHAGMPVEEGEKYAFNLWFKECNSKKLYSSFNPNYYKETEMKIEDKIISDNNKTSLNLLHREKEIFYLNNMINDTVISNLIHLSSFNNDVKRRSSWIKLDKVNEFISYLENKLKLLKPFFENINVVEYLPGHHHGKHFTAYDLNSTKGKEYTQQLGQRVYTITLILNDSIKIDYPNINTSSSLKKGDILICRNIISFNNMNRDPLLERIITNTGNETAYIANIYVREKDLQQNKIQFKSIDTEQLNKINKQPIIAKNTIIENENEETPENYTLTLETVLDKFENNLIHSTWNQYQSFKYCFKGDFLSFKNYVLSYKKIKDKFGCLNNNNLNKSYTLNPDLPLEIVNNVLNNEYLNLLQQYYRENIDKNIWPLGDRQSKRYKAHNEAFSRFLHYEILPLIEKITNKSLKPTYTYLSCYVKGADLPGHTDREDCEYTVSFVIDKPKDTTWNIYLHKTKQPIKYKGRYPENPPKNECIPVDCNAGGLMIFQGTDHIHFREELNEDYYNIILLHYCSI